MIIQYQRLLGHIHSATWLSELEPSQTHDSNTFRAASERKQASQSDMWNFRRRFCRKDQSSSQLTSRKKAFAECSLAQMDI
jgi:hypothetical protein